MTVRELCAEIVRRGVGTITGVKTSEMIAALTFDDGPLPDVTPSLLDILNRFQCPSTFFMIGESAKEYPEIVRQVAEAGHAIGNHSWDHSDFRLLSGRARCKQIRECARVLAPYGDHLFRPPFGYQNVSAHFDTILLGYKVIAWSLDVKDWDANGPIPQKIEFLMTKIKPGSIILMHHSEATVKILGSVLEQMEGRFQFVTVPELLRRGRPQRENWYR